MKTAKQQCTEGLEQMAKASFVIAAEKVLQQLIEDAKKELWNQEGEWDFDQAMDGSTVPSMKAFDHVMDWLTHKHDEIRDEALAAGYAFEVTV